MIYSLYKQLKSIADNEFNDIVVNSEIIYSIIFEYGKMRKPAWHQVAELQRQVLLSCPPFPKEISRQQIFCPRRPGNLRASSWLLAFSS